MADRFRPALVAAQLVNEIMEILRTRFADGWCSTYLVEVHGLAPAERPSCRSMLKTWVSELDSLYHVVHTLHTWLLRKIYWHDRAHNEVHTAGKRVSRATLHLVAPEASLSLGLSNTGLLGRHYALL